MAETAKKMTRKEKIAAGVEKKPKRKTAYAAALKEKKDSRPGATLNNYPTSERKMRLVIDQIRGKDVADALNILKYTTRAGAVDLVKLLKSAINNWQIKNEGVRLENAGLFVKEVSVDQSRVLKRFRPAPQGRAYRIRKRSNHVTLVLGTKEAAN